MKRVFNTSWNVIHLFAQQSQSDARGGNVYFQQDYTKNKEYGTQIFSFGSHYLLAEFLDDKTIIINDTGYSSTTSRHINEVSQATNQYKQFFYSSCKLQSVYDSVLENYKKLANARKPELYINEITYKFRKLNEFHAYKRNLTKIKKDPLYREIKRIINSLDVESAKKALNKEQSRKDRLFKNEVKQFKAHKINRFKYSTKQYDVLRMSKDGTYIETNQGVTVSTKEAKRLLNLIDNKKIIGAKVNNEFTVTAFNGIFRAGCHKIPVKEINAIRKQLQS